MGQAPGEPISCKGLSLAVWRSLLCRFTAWSRASSVDIVRNLEAGTLPKDWMRTAACITIYAHRWSSAASGYPTDATHPGWAWYRDIQEHLLKLSHIGHLTNATYPGWARKILLKLDCTRWCSRRLSSPVCWAGRPSRGLRPDQANKEKHGNQGTASLGNSIYPPSEVVGAVLWFGRTKGGTSHEPGIQATSKELYQHRLKRAGAGGWRWRVVVVPAGLLPVVADACWLCSSTKRPLNLVTAQQFVSVVKMVRIQENIWPKADNSLSSAQFKNKQQKIYSISVAIFLAMCMHWGTCLTSRRT